MELRYLERKNAPRLAYCRLEPAGEGAKLPEVMFLGGFRSDMEGTKALYLQEQCRARGQGFIRFDYRGHGKSEGAFEDGTIGLWKDDALAVLDGLTRGDAVLAGSSMGGWIALLLALERPARIRGVVGIAAAPDFTREIEKSITEAQRREMDERGFIGLPSDYSDEPYTITRKLIEDGGRHCLLERDNVFRAPLRLVQGMRDTDVEWQTAWRIKNSVVEGDVQVLLVEEGDHRLSTPADLALIDAQVRALSGLP